MTEILTCSYRAYRPSMGLPVVISNTAPKWMPKAAAWPRIKRLTPKWSYLNADDWADQFRAQLDRYGVDSIRQRLEQLAAETGATTLVVLCHESDGSAASCHRGVFREWANAHGLTVTEAEGASHPSFKGEFRERDDQGRQIVQTDGRWTYASPFDLAVGDRVLAPWGKQLKVMTVTQIGSDFAGPVKQVISKEDR